MTPSRSPDGILSVLCTPFTSSGDLDEAGLVRLIEHQLTWGVDGVVLFGLAGELYKLTDEERTRITEVVCREVDGQAIVIAATEHSGIEAAMARSCRARDQGVDAVMLLPPSFVKPSDAQLIEYYLSVADEVRLPIVIQDAPAWSGVPMSAELLVSIARQANVPVSVKVEAPPSAPKIRALVSSEVGAIGGYGALHLLEDLDAGVSGVMPGCALPGLYRDLMDEFQDGGFERAFGRFSQVLPLLAFQMSSLDLFVAVQKRLLYEIGILSSARLRRPAHHPDEAQARWLGQLLDATGARSWLAAGPPTDC